MTDHLCDTNVWLALAVTGHAHHQAAREWVNSVRDPDTILFCRSTQQSLLRVLTQTSILAGYGSTALTNEAAWAVFDEIHSDGRVLMLSEPTDLDRLWVRFSRRPQSSPKLWMDAYLAAFSIAGNHRLVTFDRAFRQFEGLDLLLLGEDG